MRTCGDSCLRLFLCIFCVAGIFASTTTLAPIIVKAKKDPSLSKWKFIESLDTNHETVPGFEEQQLKNVPGVTIITNGNPGQLTTISIQGTASRYTKILWSGLSVSEAEADVTLIPLSTGKVEVIKGIHCAEYGNGAIGGLINVVPFSMPNDQNGGVKLSVGNYVRSHHLWWRQKTKDFSLQQHIESDLFNGKNSIPKRYQDTYLTAKSPKTEKQYFLNKLGFENHHAKAALQVGFVKLGSTGSDIFLVNPYDSRDKKTLQLYALDLESKAETIQPFLKILNARTHTQHFSPYKDYNTPRGFENSKARLGVKIRHDLLVFEPVVEHHYSVLNSSGSHLKKNHEYAFAQGVHLNKDNLTWKNWGRVHKANHFKQVYAVSSSVLTTHGDTEFSAHVGTGFRLPDLYMLNDKKHGNANLKNETAYGGNIGIAQKTILGTFSLLIFRTEHKQQITYKNDQYINLNKSRQKGIEVGWQNQFGSWATQLACLYTEAVSFRPKKSLVNIPKVTAYGRIFYEKDATAAGIGCRYTGRQIQPDFENNAPINRGGYPVFFGDFQYKFSEQAKWFINVENTLARHIESPHGYRNPGFQISTGMNVTW